MVIVKSGPSEKIMRRMKQPTKDLMAKGVGNVITTAAETNSMAQSRPEKCGPISETMILLQTNFYEWFLKLPGNSDEKG